jgi:hypothetical protein
MKTMEILALGGILAGLVVACDQWSDGAVVDGAPGHVGVPAFSDPGGPTPMRKLPSERNHDVTSAPPEQADPADVAYSAGSGPTLDPEEAAKAQGQRGHGIPGPGTTEGTTTGGDATAGEATGSGATTGGGTTGAGTTTGGGTTGAGTTTGGGTTGAGTTTGGGTSGSAATSGGGTTGGPASDAIR